MKKKSALKKITIDDLNDKIKPLTAKKVIKQIEQRLKNVASELTVVKQAVLETREIMVTKYDWQEFMIKVDKLFGTVEKLLEEKIVTDAQLEHIEKDVAMLKEKVAL